MKTCKAVFALLLFFTACQAGDATGRSYFQPRLPWSQHYLLQADAQRQVDKEENESLSLSLSKGWKSGAVSAQPELSRRPKAESRERAVKSHFSLSSSMMYQASTNDKNFARYFLPGGKNNLVVKGANAAGPCDISATWLQIVGSNDPAAPLTANQIAVFDTVGAGGALASANANASQWLNQYSSVISLKPQFESSSATINLRYNNKIGRIPWALTFGVPFAQMRQRMGLSETAIQHQIPTRDAVPALVALDAVGGAIIIREYMQSQYSLSAVEALKNSNKRYGKISDRVLDASGLGDMSIDLSFDPCSFLTFGVRAELPTSQKATAEYLFDPVTGSNGHATIAAYATLYKELCEWKECAFAIRGHAQYQAQLPGNELRTLDLQEAGAWSRYLLLLDLQNDSHNGESGVNFLTRSVHVGSLQNMALAMNIEAKYKEISASIGYSLFTRESEKLALRGAFPDQLFIVGQLTPETAPGVFEPNTVYTSAKNISIGQHIKFAQDGIGNPLPGSPRQLSADDLNLKSASMPQYFSQQLLASISYVGQVQRQFLAANIGASYEFLRYSNSYNTYSLFGALTLKM
ncbi:hypothetical protein FJ365_04350 [Candidatus Dependentiae bacterium]|nr:hypothetical protein [Candidatus Dependentiae bacterium]